MAGKRHYLDDVPSLRDELVEALDRGKPTPDQVAEARRHLANLRQLIRRAREREELRRGRLIDPEPPIAD
jgi:hypothetical protein